MKILGLKNLTRSDLIEILYKKDKLSVDAALENQFSSGKGREIVLQEKAAEQISQFEKKFTNLTKNENFVFVLLILVLKCRKFVRKEIAQILCELANSRPELSSPFQVVACFYQKEFCLNVQELEVILNYVEPAFYYASVSTVLCDIENTILLSQLSFGLHCEHSGQNFEEVSEKFQDKKSYNRMLSKTIEETTGILYNSKLATKVHPSSDVYGWCELFSALRDLLQQCYIKITDDFALENVEIEMKSKKTFEKPLENWQGFSLQVSQLCGILQRLTQNNLSRIQNLVNPGLNEEYSELNKQLAQNQSLMFTTSESEPFLNVSKYQQNLQKSSQLESFVALLFIESQHFKLNQRGEKIEEKDEENDKKDKKKDKKRVQLGRSTNIIFNSYLESFSNEKKDNELPAEFKRINETLLNLNKFSFIQEMVDLISVKNDVTRKPKLPKGTRDFTPLQMSIRQKAFQTIHKIFLKHGAVELDTPVFELKETLTGKYGEDSKLIYDLEDQGGELLSLRYDLTVPFARYVGQRGLAKIKRYHIAKVYRRDQPQMTKGRFREFYQCDFDIAGTYDSMIPDAEVLKIIDEILTELEVGHFVIKVNNRKLLDAMVELSGSPKQKFKAICSAIDKLDKEPWQEVRRELIEDKGLSSDMADKLGVFVEYKGNPFDLLQKLEDDKIFEQSKLGQEALGEMKLLFDYLKAMDGLKNVSFDLSLARGLDYYTGVIVEAVFVGGQVGSICGGGRYDTLVGMFSNKQVPSIGASIGIERVFTILEEKYKDTNQIRAIHTEVFVATIGKGLAETKLQICSQLWANDIKTEYAYKKDAKTADQLEYCLENMVPFILWIGESEIKDGVVKLKNLYKQTEEIIKMDDLIQVLKLNLASYYEDLRNNNIKFYKDQKQQ